MQQPFNVLVWRDGPTHASTHARQKEHIFHIMVARIKKRSSADYRPVVVAVKSAQAERTESICTRDPISSEEPCSSCCCCLLHLSLDSCGVQVSGDFQSSLDSLLRPVLYKSCHARTASRCFIEYIVSRQQFVADVKDVEETSRCTRVLISIGTDGPLIFSIRQRVLVNTV